MTPSLPNIPDRYAILDELGSGGMGTVYKAHDKSLDQIVALKLLHVSGSKNPDQMLRFNREARACAKLRHKNIVGILDFGFFESQTPYMVLEYVEGQTLKTRIKNSGKLPPDEAVEIFTQIASALGHAHDHKIIHRDIKSANVLLSEDKNGNPIVKIFDFGIANFTSHPEHLKLTESNALIGTPSIMSPEQAKGLEVEARSDIYSFGCVMFETLTGKMPFSAKDIFTLLEMQTALEAPAVGSLEPELAGTILEEAVACCLKKDPADRFQSALEIADFLNSDTTKDDAAPIDEQKIRSRRIATILLFAAFPVMLFPFFSQLIRTSRLDGTAKVSEAPDSKKNKKIDWKSAMDPNETDRLFLAHIPDFKESDILSIPQDQSVRQVDLTYLQPDLSENGFQYLSGLKSITGIRACDMDMLTTGSIKQLGKMQQLTYLCVDGTKLEDVSSLGQLKNLNSLEVQGFSPDDVQKLQQLPIKYLRLTDVTVNAAMIEALSGCRKLKALIIVKGVISSQAGFSVLENLQLDQIEFTEIDQIPENVFASLAKLKTVTKLRFKQAKLSDEKMARLAALPRLKELNLEGSTGLSDKAFSYFSKMPKLEHLNLTNTQKFQSSALKKFISKHRSMIRVKRGYDQLPLLNESEIVAPLDWSQ